MIKWMILLICRMQPASILQALIFVYFQNSYLSFSRFFFFFLRSSRRPLLTSRRFFSFSRRSLYFIRMKLQIPSFLWNALQCRTDESVHFWHSLALRKKINGLIKIKENNFLKYWNYLLDITDITKTFVTEFFIFGNNLFFSLAFYERINRTVSSGMNHNFTSLKKNVYLTVV